MKLQYDAAQSSSFLAPIVFIIIACYLQVQLVYGQDVEQIQKRIYEQIDNFMSPPLERLQVWSDYIDLGGFPNNMNALDRDEVSKYLYSTIRTTENYIPFYGLEDGLVNGYINSVRTENKKTVVAMTYREPGDSGYIIGDSNSEPLMIHLNTCIDDYAGAEKQCLLEEGDTYVSCINDCELIKCPDPDSQKNCSSLEEIDSNRDDCESKIIWCKNYEQKQVTSEETSKLGYIPLSDYCFDSQAINSQVPEEIVYLETETGNITLGTCIYEDSKALVDREVPPGPYGECVEGICSNTFDGGYTSTNYDPRYRSWYIEARTAQRPRWSDAYVFASLASIGITATHPISSFDDVSDRTIFDGVLGADLLLDDISEFLEEAVLDNNYSVAVYEFASPNKMIATSTGSSIVKYMVGTSTVPNCTDDQVASGSCALERITIDELDNTTEDRVLRNAHREFQAFNGSDVNELISVKDSDNTLSQTYLATSLIYEQPGANLKWVTIVTEPLERDSDDAILKGDPLFIVVCIIASLGFVVCLALFLLFFWYRNERIIILADYRFTSAFIVMCALLNLASLTYLGERTDESCMRSMWVFNMLIAMALSPLFVKTFRTYRLLGCPLSVGRVQMSNCQAWLRVIPIPLLEAIILTVFTIVDPPRVIEEVDYGGQTPVQSLTCANESSAYTTTQSVYYVILVAAGCILAFLTRHIDPRFADAKALIFAMYNIAFTVIMIVAIVVLVELSDEARFTITSLGIFWVTVFSSFVFVVPRVMKAKQDRDSDLKEQSLRVSQAGPVRKMSSRVVSSANDMIHESDDTLKVLVCSANMGNAEPTLTSMKAWIPSAGNCNETESLQGQPIETSRFDLIAIGMQEATWNTPKKIGSSRKTNYESDDSVDIDFDAELDQSQAYLAAVEGEDTVLLREITKTILGDEYVLVKEEFRGQMRLYIWALKGVTPHMEDMKVSGANTGIGNVLANKGGIVISFTYQNTRLSFLSAHLAAHEGESYYQARCENMYDILRSSKTFGLSQKFDLSLSSHHMLVFGDLNFRTKFEETADHNENVRRALKLIKEEDFHTLYSYDELHKGVKEGDLLAGFETLPCRFHPTFKVQREPGFVYKNQRTPSYTDRILFRSGTGLTHFLRPLSYEPCVDFITSDHKPIRGAFSIVTNEMVDAIDMDCRFRMVFSDMECSDLPAGDMDGLSDPFLMFVWDGIDMTEKSKRRKFRCSKLRFEEVWPHTSYISKTLNPKWTGKQIEIVSTGHKVNSESVLYIAAFDYDFGSTADVLGTLQLSVLDLVRMKDDENRKELNFNRPLYASGRSEGRIKFKLVVEKFIG